MIVRVLGSHGSELTVAGTRGLHECRTCGFLVDDTVMLDAGTISAALVEDEQAKIRHVLVSHTHIDHIKALPLLADNMAGFTAKGPIQVWSVPVVLDGLRHHVFNDVIYPDFTCLPTAADPVIALKSLEEGVPSTLDGYDVTAVPVDHIVPAVGFIIRDGEGALLYSGDTSETRHIWEAAREERRLKAAFIETSFPNELAELAKTSGHLTPEMLGREWRKLGRPDIPIYIYHRKPPYGDLIAEELARLNLPNVSVLEEGQRIRI